MWAGWDIYIERPKPEWQKQRLQEVDENKGKETNHESNDGLESMKEDLRQQAVENWRRAANSRNQ